MADPISIIGLLAVGAHSANKLCALAQSIREAPREIQDISEDSRSICDVLATLKEFLEENKESELPIEITRSLHVPLENTCKAADKLVDRLKPFSRGEGESKTSKLVAGLKWSFVQKDVKQLGEQLNQGKTTLNVTLAVVNV